MKLIEGDGIYPEQGDRIEGMLIRAAAIRLFCSAALAAAGEWQDEQKKPECALK
jgi:hypothetical protein